MDKIQVFVMTRNRPNTVLKAIDSIVAQTYLNLEIVVSDNSTNEETSKLLEPYVSAQKIKYVRQVPMAGVDHLNKVHDMVEAKYYMIFHDDDTMHPDMVKQLYELAERFPGASAIGANANIIRNGRFFRTAFQEKRIVVLKTVDQLISRYTKKYAIAPFPSYMYNKEKVGDLRTCYAHGGKYADVSFLSDLACKGYIIYAPEPLMDYYIHSGQDSTKWEFCQYVTLTNYLKKVVREKETVKPLRLINIYHVLIQDKTISLISRRCIFTICNLPFLYAGKLTVKKLLGSN